jgi:hypothetical protein
MTGRQEYDRTKDRQRTLDKYMIDCRYYIYDIPHANTQKNAVKMVFVLYRVLCLTAH